MYGIVDIGVQWVESGLNKGTTALPDWSQESIWAIQGGYQSGSRFGVRGSEALGQNWNAVFTLEMGFNPDDGTLAQGGRVWGRQAWAGLQHDKFGTFALGRIATPSSGTGSFDLWGNVDPFQTGWGLASLGSTFIPSSTLREDNSVIWASPTWAGFRLAAQYSARVDGQETAPNSTNTTAWNFGANWTWGPLFLAVTYDVISYPDATTATPCVGTINGCADQKMLQLGGSWDFKFLKIHGAWANQDNISVAITGSGIAGTLPSNIFIPTGTGNYNNNAWMLGVTVPLFGGSLLASYQYSDADNIVTALSTTQLEPDYSVWGIGYSYPFSRRTNMYIGYAQREWDGTIASATIPGGTLSQASQSFDRSQFAIGIRHLF
jgi:predicted porin